jgi:hypothetical protein
LRVLAERMVVLGYVETVSHETVRTHQSQLKSPAGISAHRSI